MTAVWGKTILSIIFFLIFPLLYQREKTIVKNILYYILTLPQFYLFSSPLLSEFSINTTNNAPGSHPPLSHLKHVITNIVILLNLREISHEASMTSWLFFPRFSSLFNYNYLKCSYQIKIKNNNKSKRPQYVWYTGIFPSQKKCTTLRRQNLLQSLKDVHKVLERLWKIIAYR